MADASARRTIALQLVLDVFRLANVWGQIGNRLAGTYGLTAQQWLALTGIALGGEEGVTPTEVGKTALVSPQNVTGLLDRLERAGYVERRPVNGDRRSYRVRLTTEGKRVFQALNPVGAVWAQKAIAGMPQEKILALQELVAEYLAAATKVAFPNGHPRKPAFPIRSLSAAEQRNRQPVRRQKISAVRSQQLGTES